MEGKKILRNWKTVFIYLMFAVGITGHMLNILLPLMLFLTPYTLLLLGLFVLFYSYQKGNYLLLLWCFVTYVFTFLLEVIGVASGLIFGNYIYGDVLGFQLLNVPIIIGFNWVMVILGAIKITDYLKIKPPFNFLLTALLAVLFDFILEPVAISLNYWQWENVSVPFHNYAAWFFISLIAVYFYHSLKIKNDSTIAIHYFIAQCIFFIIIGFFI